MNPENEDEVFNLAQEAKAHLNSLDDSLSEDRVKKSDESEKIKTIRKNLELIARRADPARFPKGDPRRRSP